LGSNKEVSAKFVYKSWVPVGTTTGTAGDEAKKLEGGEGEDYKAGGEGKGREGSVSVKNTQWLSLYENHDLKVSQRGGGSETIATSSCRHSIWLLKGGMSPTKAMNKSVGK